MTHTGQLFFCFICSKNDNDCLFNKIIICFSSVVICSCLIPETEGKYLSGECILQVFIVCFGCN